MPRLAVTWNVWPSSANGAANSRSSLSASAAASAGRRTPAWTSANSSPPSRASVSLARSDRAEAGRDRAQQPVAGLVPERVVDVLEAVEVEQHHRDLLLLVRVAAARAPGAGQRLGQPVVEQRAVGQAGERVVQGQLRDPRLRRLALGDVLEHQRRGGDPPLVVADGGCDHRDHGAGCGVGPAIEVDLLDHHDLARQRPDQGQLRLRVRAPVGVHRAEAAIRGGHVVPRAGWAEDRVGLRVAEQEPARGRLDDRDAGRQVPQHRLEEVPLPAQLGQQPLVLQAALLAAHAIPPAGNAAGLIPSHPKKSPPPPRARRHAPQAALRA